MTILIKLLILSKYLATFRTHKVPFINFVTCTKGITNSYLESATTSVAILVNGSRTLM